MTHPPKPRLALRVGVTGHRLNRLTAGAPETLAAATVPVLSEVTRVLHEIWQEERSVYSSEPPLVTVVSSLAEGTDRIVAQAALDLGLGLAAPLPFERDDYARDFETEASRRQFTDLLSHASVFELDGTRADENKAYEAAGLLMLRQSDLVIAVWDGKPGAGRGGTQEIVARALATGLPVIRFDEHGIGPTILLQSAAGSATDPHELLDQYISNRSLEEIVRAIAAPPRQDPAPATRSARNRLDSYFLETEQRYNFWLAYPILQRMLWPKKKNVVRRAFMPEDYLAVAERNWKAAYWNPMQQAAAESRCSASAFKRGDILEKLQPRFAWADGLAVHYGQNYRSGYVLVFVLGAIAVFLATLPPLLSFFSHFHVSHEWTTGLELAALALIVFIFVQGRNHRWHERWLDYRLLAERLRIIRVLALTGSTMPELPVPHFEEGLQSQQSWVMWYVRATVREIDMPTGKADAGYARVVSHALCTAELNDQMSFHAAYADREHHLGQRLEKIGEFLFATSAAFAVFIFFSLMLEHLLEWWLNRPLSEFEAVNEKLPNVAMFTSAFLPAAGAALFGIRTQGEFERNTHLSEATHHRLERIKTAIDANAHPAFAAVAGWVDATANTLTTDLSDWRFVFWGKPLTLPG